MVEAAEKKIGSADAEMMNWVRKVSSAVYEAATDVAKSSASSKVHCRSFASFLYGWRMGHKITRICKELAQFAQTAADAGVSGIGVDNQSIPNLILHGESMQMDELIVGRDDDIRRVLDVLLDTSNLNDDISVVSIVGMGGVGKTTLARLVCNDERVTDHFDLKLWVCVSDGFGIREIISKIVTSCSASTTSKVDGLGFEQLISLLQVGIREKLFLLVLDEVWNDDAQIWPSLKSLLTVGARGSRILVTTRSSRVAETMQAICKIDLATLTSEASWDLFESIAFSKLSPTENLIYLAKEILGRCSGIPLAIKVVAQLLHQKNEDEWKHFLACSAVSTVINRTQILDTLMISYSHLSSPLKACFAYLSLFPKDCEFNILDVISLWQAQGFLDPADQLLEDVGNEYFLILANRGFVMDLARDEYESIGTFMMHDLMHDLALRVAEGLEKIHVSLLHGRETKLLPENLVVDVDGHKLRTFLYWVPPEDVDRMIVSEVMKISNFKSLRVLDLHAFGIHILPDSVGNLIHLRYLDLSHNEFLVKLPNSIANLYNLQTLKLNFCYDLKELPTSMRKLVCLRRLEIDGCEKLTFMPPGFENLTSLQMLPRYVVGRPRFQSTSGFKAIGNLNWLQGRLMIELSENWTSAVNETAKSNLRSKTRLTELGIKWGPTRHTSKTDSLQHHLLV